MREREDWTIWREHEENDTFLLLKKSANTLMTIVQTSACKWTVVLLARDSDACLCVFMNSFCDYSFIAVNYSSLDVSGQHARYVYSSLSSNFFLYLFLLLFLPTFSRTAVISTTPADTDFHSIHAYST